MDAEHNGTILRDRFSCDIVTEAGESLEHADPSRRTRTAARDDDDSGKRLPVAYTTSSYYDRHNGIERPTATWRGYTVPPTVKTAKATDPASAWLAEHDPDAFADWVADGFPMTD
jgi:hypothetical protein